MARRFIVNDIDIKYEDDNNFYIYGSEVHHIQVLRHNIGESIHINDFICEIIDIKKDKIKLKIVGKAEKFGEPNINLTLYIALLKGEKMDLVIQKAVELGVKNIVPFFSKNVIVRLDEKDLLKKKMKFKKIADEACKQCGRTDIVKIDDFINFDDVIELSKKDDVCFFAYENSTDSIKDKFNVIKNHELKNISCIVGPEGGFDKMEVNKLKKISNIYNISLGNRILRAETAAISLCTIIMYELDK